MNATAAFRAALGAPSDDIGAAALIGLEHEYRLLRNGRAIDFRDVIHDLPVPGRRLDPGDANAYRCLSGLALTCDDAEAEVASPPVPVRPAFTAAVDGWAHTGRALLESLLPEDVVLEGFSTHLSAAMADDRALAVAARFARRFGPAAMLLVDRPASHGIFVRPRPGRLELCCDYAAGDRLRAAAAFVAGAVRACADGRTLPPALAVNSLKALGRYGIELDRQLTFGFDFYRSGRAARLPLASGGTITAQEHLQRAWASARSALDGTADAGDLAAADRVVDGSRPLGVETDSDTGAEPGEPTLSPFGGLLRTRQRPPGYCVAATVAMWAYTVFELAGHGRRAYACVPRAQLDRFLTALDGGALDSILARFLASPPSRLRLSSESQTHEPRLWDELSVSGNLVPREREPFVGPAASSGHAKGARVVGARAGKPSTLRAPPAEAERSAPLPGSTVPPPWPPGEVPVAPPLNPVPLPVPEAPVAPVPAVVAAVPVGATETSAVVGTEPARPTGRPAQVPVPAIHPLHAAPRLRRRRAALIAVAVAVVLAAAGVALGAGLFGGQKTAVDVVSTSVVPPTTVTRTAPAAPTTPTSAPGTTTTTVGTTSSAPVTTAVPATTVATAATTRPTGPAPTGSGVPATEPPPTTTATTLSATTTTTLPPPFEVTVGVGCTFTPSALTRPRGAAIRFRNATNDSVTITGAGPPGSSDAVFSLDSGGLSGLYTLTVAGPYGFQCTGSGSGSMVVTAN